MTSSNQHSDYVSSLSVGTLTVASTVKFAPGATEWKTYTPTILGSAGAALGTGGSTVGRYRITGQTLELQFFHNQTVAGTTGGAGLYLFNLPTGCTPADTTGIKGVGSIGGGGTSFIMFVTLITGTVLGFSLVDPASTTTSSWGPAITNKTLGETTLSFSFMATIPLNPTSAILRQ